MDLSQRHLLFSIPSAELFIFPPTCSSPTVASLAYPLLHLIGDSSVSPSHPSQPHLSGLLLSLPQWLLCLFISSHSYLCCLSSDPHLSSGFYSSFIIGHTVHINFSYYCYQFLQNQIQSFKRCTGFQASLAVCIPIMSLLCSKSFTY